MSDLLCVACVQLTARADKARNLETAERLAGRAAAAGADVVVLPEKWNGVAEPEGLGTLAEPLEGGESVAAMASWARTHGISLVGGSITELDRARLRSVRTALPSLANRRPDAYRPSARA